MPHLNLGGKSALTSTNSELEDENFVDETKHFFKILKFSIILRKKL